MASDSQKLVACVKDCLDRVNDMHFDIVNNELNYREFNQLYDAYVNLKFSEVPELRTLWKNSFTDETLRLALEHRYMVDSSYIENGSAKYDPIKPRVMGAFTESLVKANLQDLHVLQENETRGMHKEMFPYSPDILLSHSGQKVGVFVLNDDAVMRDTQEPCGFTAGKMQLVSFAHEQAGKTGTSTLKPVALPV
jgi:hypothetical protein